MISNVQAQEFLSHHRLVVVGASDDPKNFGRTIHRELCSRGYDAVAVNPNATMVNGRACMPDLDSVAGDIDGAIIMVGQGRAAEVVRACAARGIRRVWLFKGVGPGALCDEAVDTAHQLGVEVVAGACPLMFLEPVGWFHRMHRSIRCMKGAVKMS